MSEHYGNQTTEWFAAEKARIRVMTRCAFCNMRLSVHSPPNGVDVEAFAILPCGHAFGFGCLEMWLEHTPECPTCGASAKHRRCGHLVELEKKQQIHKRIFLDVTDLAEFPSRCHDCTHRERRERRERQGASNRY
ncbi:hypothetical protein F5B17DRAFT_6567 [Nemania serpens]|nr:hypothetical protein F5B17DRAFT_6567 [Nemania serpens]